MAGALIGGLLKSGFAPAQLRVAEPDATRAASLRAQFGVTVDSAEKIVPGAQALVLAVKPQQAVEALRGLKADKGAVALSIMAGVRVAALSAALGPAVHVVRSMPNTPALLGAGISGLYAVPSVPAEARALAERILSAAGECVWLPQESDLDAVTALSGSGPAYFFLLTEVLREAGVKLGLDAATAARLAQATFTGSAAMAAQPNADVVQMRANVTSKGGTTQAAVEHLEAQGIRKLFADALHAAQTRSAELGDALETQFGKG